MCLKSIYFHSLQSTHEGFDHVNSENVFKVCDEPHPLLIKDMLTHCSKGDMDPAYKIARHLWNLGYSAEDIITNIFRVCKTHNELPEFLKLEFIKQIGYTHLLIAQGTSSLLQLSALLARLCQLVESAPKALNWSNKVTKFTFFRFSLPYFFKPEKHVFSAKGCFRFQIYWFDLTLSWRNLFKHVLRLQSGSQAFYGKCLPF